MPPHASSAPSTARTSTFQIALMVAVAHAVTDLYQAFLPPLLPRMMEKLGLSIGLAAMAAMVLSLAGSLAQPLMGYLADRWGRRMFVILGPLLSGVFISLIGWAPTLPVLLVLLVLGGLGSAAFHPPGASLAVRLEAGSGSGFRYSMFSLGGTLGFALGPVTAVWIVSARGLEGLWIAMIPAVLAVGLILVALPPDAPSRSRAEIPWPSQILGMLRGPLGLVFGVSAAGAFLQRVFLTMEPIIAAEAGLPESLAALMLSVYLASQALGTVAGGVLTDRMDRRVLLAGITALALPTHLLALWLPAGSIGALGFAAASGFLNMALLPPVVVMAQEMVPEGTAVSSGIVMGLAWALGSIGVLGTGFLADSIGPLDATLLSIPIILVGTVLSLHPALEPFARPAAR